MVIKMVKYRCVKADVHGGVYWEGRQYVEEGIKDARKRAMRMIHGEKYDCVLIWLESDFKKRPWLGYKERVILMDSKRHYAVLSGNKFSMLDKDGSAHFERPTSERCALRE